MAGFQLKNPNDYRTYGDALVDRLFGDEPVAKPTGPLLPYAKAFRSAHADWSAAEGSVEAANALRDERVTALTAADDALDASVVALADELVVAKVTKRTKPFKGLSKYSPSELTALAHAKEVDEVRALVKKIEKKGGGALKKPTRACGSNADAVAAAIKALSSAQSKLTKALAARDALIPAWTKAHASLKKWAGAVFADDAGTFAALFAPPSKEARPVAKKGKGKGKKAKAPPTPPKGSTGSS